MLSRAVLRATAYEENYFENYNVNQILLFSKQIFFFIIHVDKTYILYFNFYQENK